MKSKTDGCKHLVIEHSPVSNHSVWLADIENIPDICLFCYVYFFELSSPVSCLFHCTKY